VEISVLSLARDGGSESGFSLSSAIVSFILQKDGIHKARDIYKRYEQWNQCGVLFSIVCCMGFLSCICYNSSTILHCRYLALPHPGLALYRKCIELEANLASTGDKNSLANARKLYESALATYDQNVDFWQDYYHMEVKVSKYMYLIDHVFSFQLLVGFSFLLYLGSLSIKSNNAYIPFFWVLILQMGTSQQATAVYWRARKILKDASEFIASPDL